MDTEKIKLFYSYSHKDEDLRDQLETQLSILRRNGLIEEWHDRKITSGKNLDLAIEKALEDADIVLLLVSPDFIASDYCYETELKKAIELHEANQLRIIPVIIRPVDWSETPFHQFLAVPKDGLAVTSWSNVDEAWVDVTVRLKDSIKEISKIKFRGNDNAGLKRVSSLLSSEVERLDKFSVEDVVCSGLSSGLIDFDSVTDGFHPSDLIVLASRPEMGASELAHNIAIHISVKLERPVAYFSFQLPSSRLLQKLMSSLGHIKHHEYMRGAFDDEDWERLTYALAGLNDAPLFVDDSNTLSFSELSNRIKKLKSKKGDLGLIVIDSIQNLAFQCNLAVSEFANISKSLKQLAKELQTPILITSNVSSNIEQRIDKRPLMKDLGDWRELEHDADVITFLYRSEVYDRDSHNKGTAELIVTKNSYGSIGTIRTVYLEQFFKFENFAHETYENRKG